MSTLLTNSRLKTYRECPKRHHYAYELGYRPVSHSWKMDFGTLMHAMLECWLKGNDFLIEDLVADLDLDLDELRIAQARALYVGYIGHYGHMPGVEAVEVSFDCPLPHANLNRMHPTYRLGGKIDVVCKAADGHVLIDHKTTGAGYNAESVAALENDTQITQYFIGAEALGYRPVRWIHDIIVRPSIMPKLATPEADRKYTKPTKANPEPKLYANQREDDESLIEYEARLFADIQSRPDHYFRRVDVYRMDEDIRRYLVDTWATIKHMEMGEQPRNPNACYRWGECPYRSACVYGVDPAEDSMLEKIENVHPELG